MPPIARQILQLPTIGHDVMPPMDHAKLPLIEDVKLPLNWLGILPPVWRVGQGHGDVVSGGSGQLRQHPDAWDGIARQDRGVLVSVWTPFFFADVYRTAEANPRPPTACTKAVDVDSTGISPALNSLPDADQILILTDSMGMAAKGSSSLLNLPPQGEEPQSKGERCETPILYKNYTTCVYSGCNDIMLIKLIILY